MFLSVLMSIYHKESPDYFNQAMESIWDKQTYKPSQIILVEDGELNSELYSTIAKWQDLLGSALKVIKLEQNQGLANALNVALSHCQTEFIARMDTDDIAQPERFERQLVFLKQNADIDAVGTWICEIDENNHIIKDKVEYPLKHQQLYQFFSKRDPIAHPTAMFRRAYFEKSGNYSNDLFLAEDTLLWYSGFMNHCKIANIEYIGLAFRRNSQFYKRRANIKKSIGLLKFRLFKINRDLKYGLKSDLCAIAYFLMSVSPSFIKKLMYRLFR